MKVTDDFVGAAVVTLVLTIVLVVTVWLVG